MSNSQGDWPEWHDPAEGAPEQGPQHDGLEELLHVGHDDTGEPTHDTTARHFVFFVSLVLIVLAVWVVYLVNPTWYIGSITVTVGIVISLIAYRVSSGALNSIFFALLVVTNAWLVYLFHPTLLLFLLALLCLLFVPLLILRLTRGSLEEAEKEAAARLNKPPTLSHRVKKKLVTNEVVWQEASQHPARLTFWGLLVLAVSFAYLVAGFHGVSLLWLWVVVVLIAALRLAAWWDSRFCFTNLRVLRVNGIFNIKLAEMPLSKITDMTFMIPWHSRLQATLRIINVQYGTFRFESAGQKQGIKKATFVPNAQAVYLKFTEQMLQSSSTPEMSD